MRFVPIVVLALATLASAESRPVKVGDAAPGFSLKDQNGKPVALSDFEGKRAVVIAFYPKSFTGG